MILLLVAFSIEECDDLYCVSLKKDFKISNNINYSIMWMDFNMTNADIFRIPHKPEGWILNFSSNSFGGCVLWFPAGVRLDFFYDDFVVIKKEPGIKISEVRFHLEFSDYEVSYYNNDTKSDEAEKRYTFTNKSFNIHRCNDKSD